MSRPPYPCVPTTLAWLIICLLPIVTNGQSAPGRVEMPGTRVSLVPPPGFTLNDQIQALPGSDGITIVVGALDQPFVETSADMKQAKRADMTILAARPARLENGRLATRAHIGKDYARKSSSSGCLSLEMRKRRPRSWLRFLSDMLQRLRRR